MEITGKLLALELKKNCHFDERSEEKSYISASFTLRVSSLRLIKRPQPAVETTRFLALLEMTGGVVEMTGVVEVTEGVGRNDRGWVKMRCYRSKSQAVRQKLKQVRWM